MAFSPGNPPRKKWSSTRFQAGVIDRLIVLLTNPRILIFDEATSALDYESEHIIQQNMLRICQGRTVFVVAHRLSTVRRANRIFVIEKGEIIEQGNHQELLQLNGYYSRLNKHQEGTYAVG